MKSKSIVSFSEDSWWWEDQSWSWHRYAGYGGIKLMPSIYLWWIWADGFSRNNHKVSLSQILDRTPRRKTPKLTANNLYHISFYLEHRELFMFYFLKKKSYDNLQNAYLWSSKSITKLPSPKNRIQEHFSFTKEIKQRFCSLKRDFLHGNAWKIGLSWRKYRVFNTKVEGCGYPRAIPQTS